MFLPKAADGAIVVHQARKTYKDFVAVDGVSFVIPPGTVLGLLGPNGAGKTTIVKMLATLLAPSGGELYVAGFNVGTQAHEVRTRIGLAGQYAAIDENLTAVENLEMIARLHRMSRADAAQKARDLLVAFILQDAANRPLKTYSGGMRRRLDLAASLVGDPEVLFLDEPTAGLDPKSRLDLWHILRGLIAQGKTILLTTQYLEEADALADHIVMIDHGRIVAEGTVDALKSARGGDIIDVHAEDIARAPELANLLADMASGPSKITEDGRVSVPVKARTKSLFEAVRRIDASGIPIADIALRRPTLDEVFLDLTGTRP